ncbi:MAG: 3-phosphoserine/phosphohydroxythreonine transaminase [Myxococcota bacterium]
MTHRVMNFSPGPATLPLSALEKAEKDLVDFDGTGISILEHSHRGKDYAAVHSEAKQLLRDLLSIPDTHEVLFMQGGATAQFALLPMNFLGNGQSADYVVTGTWSVKAVGEGKVVAEGRGATVNEAANTKTGEGTFQRVPKANELQLDPNAAYVHLTSNNTIFGTQFHDFPDTGKVPLVADMSSDILWRPVDVSKFDLIYAGAQKNLGPAGVTVVIIRKEWAEQGRTDIPKIFRYSTILGGDSLQNTAPTFPIYMVRNVLQWVKANGGAEGMEKRNRGKAELLYGAIDAEPDFYRCPVEPESRSVMNVVFRLPSEALEQKFLEDAKAKAMVNLKGHRSVGGIRASLYNAMEPDHVQKLVDFMHDFVKQNR